MYERKEDRFKQSKFFSSSGIWAMFKKKKSGSVLYKLKMLTKVGGDIYTWSRNLWFLSANHNKLQRVGKNLKNKHASPLFIRGLQVLVFFQNWNE